jgi:BirA family biotin operon repressor/biotin-[acetyl-CoA-carboxylase] ligase
VDTQALSAVSAQGWDVTYVDATGSTNALAAADPVPGRVVVTDHQTAGRGRLDRVWDTPAGVALTFSVVVDPGLPDEQWPWLPLLTGVAVAGAVRRTSGLAVTLKWPNDVLVGDRKLAGILVERVATPGGPVAVVGVGVNAHQTVPPVPGATSLAIEGSPVDRSDLLVAALEELSRWLADWRGSEGGASGLRASYTVLCGTLGRDVRVELPGDRTVRGRAESVDRLGRLVVRTTTGEVLPMSAGDVVHLRAANPPEGVTGVS